MRLARPPDGGRRRVNGGLAQFHALLAIEPPGPESPAGEAQEHDAATNNGDHGLIPLPVREIRMRYGRWPDLGVFRHSKQ